MKIIHCFLIMIGLVVGLIGADVSLTSAKTLEGGHASTSWIGSGEVHDLADGGRRSTPLSKA